MALFTVLCQEMCAYCSLSLLRNEKSDILVQASGTAGDLMVRPTIDDHSSSTLFMFLGL